MISESQAKTLEELAAVFPSHEIEWRLQTSGISGSKPWGKAVAYIDNRAIMRRLDDVFGPGGWRNEYQPISMGKEEGLLCGISCLIDGIWVTKWDGAAGSDGFADQEIKIKGACSNSMKRAAAQWGIGRYLYDLPVGWVDFVPKGKGLHVQKIDGQWYDWRPPILPDWARPESERVGGSNGSDSQPRNGSQGGNGHGAHAENGSGAQQGGAADGDNRTADELFEAAMAKAHLTHGLADIKKLANAIERQPKFNEDHKRPLLAVLEANKLRTTIATTYSKFDLQSIRDQVGSLFVDESIRAELREKIDHKLGRIAEHEESPHDPVNQ